MLKIDRRQIEVVKESLKNAMNSATTANGGYRIGIPAFTSEELGKAAMLALQSLAMQVGGPNEIACPSDIHHLMVYEGIVDPAHTCTIHGNTPTTNPRP